MARLLATASGNFTSSGTWATVDTSALVSNSASSTVLTTSSQNSANFVPGGISVDAIALRLLSRAAGSPTNTLTIVLYDVTAGAAVATVAVPVADLPACASGTATYGGWQLFSLGGTFALTAGNNHQVRLSLNNTSTAVAFLTNGTGANWQHILRTTTTAAPAATDDLYVLGLWTASATWTQYTVTMDVTSTSTTYGSNPGTTTLDKAAGGIAIGRSTLAWATTTSSTFALKLAGPVLVQAYGTLSMGTVASPADRTTVMELMFATTTGYGFVIFDQPSATVNVVGQSRTVGKDVSQCILTANMTSGSTTTASVNADTGWLSGDQVWISTSRPQSGADQALYTLSGDATSGSVVLTAAVSANYLSTGIPAAVILKNRNVKITSDNAARSPIVYLYGQGTFTSKWASFAYTRGELSPTVAGGSITMDHVLIDTDTAGIGSSPWNLNGVVAGNTITITNWSIVNGNNSATFTFQPSGSSNLTNLTLTDVVTLTDASNIGGYCTLPLAAVAAIRRIKVYGGVGAITWVNIANGGLLTAAMTGESFWVCGGANTALVWPANGDTIENITFTDARLAASYSVGVGWCRGITFVDGYFLPDLWVFNCGTDPGGSITLQNCRLGGWSSSTPASLLKWNVSARGQLTLTLQGCDISTSSPYVQFDGRLVEFTATGGRGYNSNVQIDVIDCLGVADLGDYTGVTSASTCSFSPDSRLSFNNYNRTSGSHRTYRLGANMGLVQTDAAIYRTAAPSERMSPNHPTRKLDSSPKRYAVGAGETATVSTFVQVDGTYNGTAPRLRARANATAGWNADVTLATHGLTTGSFIELSSGFSVVDDAVVEVYVDCDGTTGSIYVDDWSVT